MEILNSLKPTLNSAYKHLMPEIYNMKGEYSVNLNINYSVE